MYFIKVKGNSNNHYVTYTRLGQLYKDSRSVLLENDGSLLLCNFAPEYQRKYNKQLKALDYGIAKIGDLVEYFSGIFKVFGEKNMKVIVLKEKYLKPENRGNLFSSRRRQLWDNGESLGQILTTESPLQIMKKAFFFHLRSSFHSQNI